MTHIASLDGYGVVSEPTTLRMERLLPGPIERVWAYLTDSDLRRRWLAAGEMTPTVGSSVELVWRNHELTDPPGIRPDGFGEEHRMECRIIELDPPRRLAITWGSAGEVSFTLESRDGAVLLTLIHRRVPDRAILLRVGAGWHSHLDILAARLEGREPEPFWDSWQRLHKDYEQRLPA